MRAVKILVLAGVFVGALCAYAYYQEEVGLFVKLRLWDKQAPDRLLSQFVKRVSAGDVQGALELCSKKNARPLEEGGKVVGVEYSTPIGPQRARFADAVPSGEIKVESVKVEHYGGGYLLVKASYPDGRSAIFQLVGGPGGLRILRVPGGLIGGPPAGAAKRP